jgi:hypothetical protein
MRSREHSPEKPAALNDAQWHVLQRAFAYDAADRCESARVLITELRQAEGPSQEELARQDEEIQWQKAVKGGRINDFERYLAETMLARYRDQALARMGELNAQAGQEKAARDEARWRKAVEQNTVAG